MSYLVLSLCHVKGAKLYNIEALAEVTGSTRRSIRYYVQRGLLPPPLGGGRGSYYTGEHKEKLLLIKKLTEQGMPLMHVKAVIEGRSLPEPADVSSGEVQSTAWERCEVAPGVEINFRPGILTTEDLSEVADFLVSLIGKRSGGGKA